MDWDGVATAVSGAIVGALFGAIATALATWWVSVRMTEQAASGGLLSAMGIVEVELRENAARIDLRASHEDAKKLTLGDWASNKNTLVSLRLNHEPLWGQLHGTYGRIYAAQSDTTLWPTSTELTALADELDKLSEQLRDRMSSTIRLPWRARSAPA